MKLRSNMKKLMALVLSLSLAFVQPAKADMFGGDGVPRMARV